MGTILIAGGTGFVGKHLIPFLKGHGHDLKVLTRKPKPSATNITFYEWDIQKGVIDPQSLQGVDTIINLTGANIMEKRWTENRKQELLESRTKSIDLLYRSVLEHNVFPHTFISSSAIGYYGAVTTEEVFSENSSCGNDFISSICRQWEETARQFETIGTRVVLLRKGVIMGEGSSFYNKIVPLAKFGINPAIGNGKQYVPWIAISDLLRLYDHMLKHTELDGIFNAVSSKDITMNELAGVFLKRFGKRKYMPNAPAFILKLIFGEMACMVLEGSRVSNNKIKESGFQLLISTP